jgi:hypothetical protein
LLALLARVYGWFTEGFDTPISRRQRRYSRRLMRSRLRS